MQCTRADVCATSAVVGGYSSEVDRKTATGRFDAGRDPSRAFVIWEREGWSSRRFFFFLRPMFFFHAPVAKRHIFGKNGTETHADEKKKKGVGGRVALRETNEPIFTGLYAIFTHHFFHFFFVGFWVDDR